MPRTLKTSTLLRQHLSAKKAWNERVAAFFTSLGQNPEAAKAIKRNHGYGVSIPTLIRKLLFASAMLRDGYDNIGSDDKGLVPHVWWKPIGLSLSVKCYLPAILIGDEEAAIRYWNDKSDKMEKEEAAHAYSTLRELRKRFDKPKGVDVVVVAEAMAVK